MRILIVTQWYDPEPIPKPGDLARELARRGHQVDVLTGLPYYPGNRVTAGYWGKSWSSDVVDQVRVMRVPEFPYHGGSGVLRALSYGTFLLTGLLGSLRLQRPDVVYSWHPPTTVGLLALAIARRFRAPLVHDIQDIWPDLLVPDVREGSFAFRCIQRMERFVRARADLILTPTPGGADSIAGSTAGLARVRVVPHWLRAGPLAPRLGRQDDGFHVLFAGNLGSVQGLDAAIEAACLLRGSRLQLHLLGDGSDKARLVEQARSLGADNVVFHPRVSAAEASARMAAADALLIGIRPTSHARTVLPTKFISYAAAGRPIIAYGATAVDQIILERQCGWVAVNPGPVGLADAFRAAMAAPAADRDARGAAARRLYDEDYQFDVVMDLYESLLVSTARRRADRRSGGKQDVTPDRGLKPGASAPRRREVLR